MKLEVKHDFSVDTFALEKEMMQKNGGIGFSEETYKNVNEKEIMRKYIPLFENITTENIKKLAADYPKINSPCSIKINSIEELIEHASIIYQVSYYNYVLGKKRNLKEQFPLYCCGISGRNVAFSLIKIGYPNAVYSYNKKHEHGYDLFPFIFKDKEQPKEIKGAILLDPTHDQTTIIEKEKKRNVLMIKIGTEWSYIPNKNDGIDYFPQAILSLDRLEQAAEYICDVSTYHNGAKTFLERAFENPIEIKLK